MAEPDLTEFLKLSKPRRATCTVAPVLDLLTKGERVKLDGALASDPGVITNQAIALWFQSRGHAIKWQWVRTHRLGTCTCND